MLLTAALEGLEIQRQRVESQIAEVGRRLGSQPAARTRSPEAPAHGRTLSSAARQRIADAQKKRWENYRAKSEQGAPVKQGAEERAPGAGKGRLSAAGRKAIAEAARKRWAAYRKAAEAPAKSVQPAKPLRKAAA